MKRMKRTLFTSESVTEGHPDKLCDQISDAILDEILTQDPAAHVACETVAVKDFLLIMGEISSFAKVDIPSVAREVIRDVGYTEKLGGFDADTCEILLKINRQSPDIAMGVNCALEAREGIGDPYDQIGAGDQGMMFGYACDETPEYMPLPISLAHQMARRLAAIRKDGTLPYLRPDGKTQVTVLYEDGVPVKVETVVVSTQHDESASLSVIRRDVIDHVIRPVIPDRLLSGDTHIYVNPTGRFVVGGPQGDSGLTGRKIIVDTYGGRAGHGGGCLSGKDPTKVDRSAAYMARYIAKNIVAAGLAKRCEVQFAYAIGVAHPVSVFVDTENTGTVSDEAIADAVKTVFDLRPAAIIDALDLARPQYRKLATYGQMGREDLNVSWERTDKTEALLNAISR